MAVPLRGGGVKGLFAIKNFFFIFLLFENKIYFTLDNLSTYGHITLKFVGWYYNWFVTIFATKYGSFSPKIGGKKIQNPFSSYFD